jgi:hypothetical protein
MSPAARRLSSWLLSRVLSRPCGSRIPRSGSNGEAVNCFVTAIDKGDDPYLIVQSLSNGQLGCIEWDGSSYTTEVELPLDSVRMQDFRITHYYGLSEVRYDGLLDFMVNRISVWPYVQIHVVRYFARFDQYFFNKRKLVSKARNDLLKLLVSEALEGRAEHESLELMTALYSIKWYSHPEGGAVHKRLEFYLDSLSETGELRKMNHSYVVTGQALRAIEEYEEQERKHTENVKMQWRTFWLALAVAALTVVQAGLVKLPALIDFTSTVATK